MLHMTQTMFASGPRLERELAIDDALEASFPASDPPAWNPGLARVVPDDAVDHRAEGHPTTVDPLIGPS